MIFCLLDFDTRGQEHWRLGGFQVFCWSGERNTLESALLFLFYDNKINQNKTCAVMLEDQDFGGKKELSVTNL